VFYFDYGKARRSYKLYRITEYDTTFGTQKKVGNYLVQMNIETQSFKVTGNIGKQEFSGTGRRQSVLGTQSFATLPETTGRINVLEVQRNYLSGENTVNLKQY